MFLKVPLVIAVLHLAITLTHDLSHRALQLTATVDQRAFALLVSHGLPALAVLLLARERARPGLGTLALGLLGSLIYVSYAHLVNTSPDQVSGSGDAGWGLAYRASAWTLAGLDALGLWGVMRAARASLLPRGPRVLLVDGTCIFCNWLVAQILKRDREGVYSFAHLQSDYGRAVLARHGAPPDDIDGVYLLTDVGTASERLHVDGGAGRLVWPSLLWGATPMLLLPKVLLDPVYVVFARIRYRLFGRYESCRIPDPSEREKFIAEV